MEFGLVINQMKFCVHDQYHLNFTRKEIVYVCDIYKL